MKKFTLCVVQAFSEPSILHFDTIIEMKINGVVIQDLKTVQVLEDDTKVELIVDDGDSGFLTTREFTSSVAALIVRTPLEDTIRVNPALWTTGVLVAVNAYLQLGSKFKSYQRRVEEWVVETLGSEIAYSKAQRNSRFLEEALELVQACSMTKEIAHSLVDYVYARPVGERKQEVGGVMVTLACLCCAQDINMNTAGELGLEDAWERIEEVRRKQAAKLVPDVGEEVQ